MAIKNDIKDQKILTIRGIAYVEMKISTVENTVDAPSLLFVPNAYILGVVRLWPKKPSNEVDILQEEDTLVKHQFGGAQLRYRALHNNLNF